MYLCRKISARRIGFYVLFQILGALMAAALILLIAKGDPDGYNASQQGLGANGFGLHRPAAPR
jgi:aquaporin Z